MVWELASAHATLCYMGTQLPKKGHNIPQFSAHVCCGQTAEWIKMSLGREVDLSPGDIVLDEDPAAPIRGHSTPNFGPRIVAKRLDGS